MSQPGCGRTHIDARLPIAFSDDGSVPEWLMYMPAGTHRITASSKGKPVTLTLTVDHDTVVSLQRDLAEHRAGKQKPFLDFDHERKGASAWPQEFAWRDKPEPGVWCKVEWSQAGLDAVRGKTYRSFSPSFFEEDGKVVGAALCMGSLVNDPAFEEMAPIWSRRANTQPEGTEENMSASNTELAALNSRIVELEAKNQELEAQAASEEAKQAIEAAKAETEAARAELAKLKEEADSRRRRDADAVVASAVSRGAIPPKDEAGQKRWRDLIIADPANAELLAKTPGRVTTDGSKLTTRSAVQLVKADTNDILRGFIACSNPRERGTFYRRELDPIYARGEQIDFSRFPVDASNVLGEVVGNIISQRTLALMVSMRPMLNGIVTDFSDERARKGQTVYTRTVGIPTVQDFGGAVSETADTDYPVTLSAHKEVKYSFTAAEYLSTNRNLVAERSQAMAVGLGNHLVDTVAALITDAFTSETTGVAGSKDFSAIVAAGKALNTAGAPPYNRNMWVNSDFAAALSEDEVVMEYVQHDIASAYGHWQNIKGFAHIWEYPAIPANTINLIGFAFQQNALLLATRVADDPGTLAGAGYPGNIQVVTDPVTGFSVLSDRWVTQATRALNTRLDVLYGCARGIVGAGHKFVSS